MARGIEGNEVATPKPSLKKSTSSASASQSQKGQRTILGFFQKKSADAPPSSSPAPSTVKPSPAPPLAAAPSSDGAAPSSPPLASSPIARVNGGKNKENGVSSSATSISDRDTDAAGHQEGPEPVSSPPRKVSSTVSVIFIPPLTHIIQNKKPVNYAESEDEDDEVILKPRSTNAASRAAKRRKIALDDSDDDFAMDDAMESVMTQIDGTITFRLPQYQSRKSLTCDRRHGRLHRARR